jgi:hypothetical protein
VSLSDITSFGKVEYWEGTKGDQFQRTGENLDRRLQIVFGCPLILPFSLNGEVLEGRCRL